MTDLQIGEKLSDIAQTIRNGTESNIRMAAVTAGTMKGITVAIVLTGAMIAGTTLFCTWLLVGAWMTPLEDSDSGPVKYEKYIGVTFGKTGPYL